MHGSRSRLISIVFVVAFLALCVSCQRGGATGSDQRVEIANKYRAPPEGALAVLFIGNSHLYTHSVPRQVQEIAASTPGARPLWSESSLYPGVTLAWHARNEATLSLLERSWDVVVIQERSLEALVAPDDWRAGTAAIVEKLEERGVERIIYVETWARHEEDPSYEKWPDWVGASYAEQQARFGEVISERAATLGMEVAPVGSAWSTLYAKRRLHSDTNHANVSGSYLTALVLHQAIQDVRATRATWAPESLDAPTRALLREHASAAFERAPARPATNAAP